MPITEGAQHVAREARRAGAFDPAPAGVVVLDHASRYLRRRMLKTTAGVELLVDLPAATNLGQGDRLVLANGMHVEVAAAAEPLAEVRAQGAMLARLAWHIGNRHTPAQVESDRLFIQRDPVLEEMLRGLGATIGHIEAPFRPEGGAYGHGRTHGHGDAHDPHHDPNAHIPHRHG